MVGHPAEVIGQFEQVAVKSLPIVLGAGLSVGLVTWLQTHRLLVTHGAESTLPSFLAVAVLVEIGPMLAGLLVASRMGAGLAAELGSMVLNEEIDARTVLGADPVPSLVAPRAIACALAVPLLTVIIDASALLGGLGAELAGGRLTTTLYWSKSLTFLRLSDVVPATFKTAVFGLLVGLVACWTGLNAGRSTEAVGRAATRSVVRATLAVFAANAVMVPLIQATVEALGWKG
jgi:phospholipid/cholesterol/gamma-HCH transport system permease protein